MTGHVHAAFDLSPSDVYVHCECGAVRRRDTPGKPPDKWHLCLWCVKPGFVAVALEAVTERAKPGLTGGEPV